MKKKFSYDVSALSAYTEQNNFPLLTKALFGGKTISMMTPQLGIKSAETLNILAVRADFQAGGACSFTSSGTTTFTQRTLTVGKIAIMDKLCPNDLEAYYLQTQLSGGTHYSTLPFEEQLVNLLIGSIQERMETAVWKGDTTDSNPDLNRFDGLIKIINAASGVVSATATALITASNVISIFQDIFVKIPAAVIDKEDLRVFCGWDVYRLLMNAITNSNWYHYVTDEAARNGEITFPGTTLRIVAVHGLNGMNVATKTCIVAAQTSNLFFGTDMMNEEENLEIREMTDLSHEIRYRADWKAGTQIAFPNQIVKYANT